MRHGSLWHEVRDRTLLLAPKRQYTRFTILFWRSAESTRSENAAKFQETRNPLTLIHMDNARIYTVRATQEKLDVSQFKCMPQPPYSPDFAPSDLFFSASWEPSLSGKNIIGKVNYMKQGMKFWPDLNRNDRNGLCRLDESTPMLDRWKWWLCFLEYHKWIFELN
jgi:hypothetical protein